MSIPRYATVYWDGDIILSDDGYDYCGSQLAIFSIDSILKYANIVMRIVRTINLVERCEFIECIISRKPKLSRDFLKWAWI